MLNDDERNNIRIFVNEFVLRISRGKEQTTMTHAQFQIVYISSVYYKTKQ